VVIVSRNSAQLPEKKHTTHAFKSGKVLKLFFFQKTIKILILEMTYYYNQPSNNNDWLVRIKRWYLIYFSQSSCLKLDTKNEKIYFAIVKVSDIQ
jgi:hypothetical protein